MNKTDPLQGLSKEEVLYTLLQKEYGYYMNILELTREENDKLRTQKPMNEINPLLKKKRIILACIAEIETAILPLKKHWQLRKEKNDQFSTRIKQELANLDRLLKEILELDLVSQNILGNYLNSFNPTTPPSLGAPYKSKKPTDK